MYMNKNEQRYVALIEQIIRDTLWMATRYADGRSSYAPCVINQSIDRAVDLGIIQPGEVPYARDGMFGDWIDGHWAHNKTGDANDGTK